jgi:hypothetical protein
MARNWDGLSEPYKHRLESHGISRNEYESGVSLSHARGHGLSRDQLIDRIQSRKIDMHGDHRKFNERRSRKAIVTESETGRTRTNAELRRIAEIYNQAEDYPELYDQLREDELSDADHYH